MADSIYRNTKAQLIEKLESQIGDNEILRESYEAAAAAVLSIQADDVGWAPLNAMREHDGFAIHHLHEIYKKAKIQTKGSPLLKQGFTLRSSYVWGRGLEIVGEIPPRFQKKIDRNYNVLFSQQAFMGNERALFNAGQHFLFYDKRTDTAYPVSFMEITNFASNPVWAADVWYYQRTYLPLNPQTNMPEVQPIIEWYPVAETQETSGKPLLKEIMNQPVNPHVVVIDVRVNRDEDEVWGTPDCLPAMPYAWAHAEYIRDSSLLLKALSTIAWKVVSKSKGNSAAAAVKVAGNRQAATTANMTADTDLVAMPKSGQVDMADGDRIASYVAAALGVSLTALLSTAGAAGGSFGAEASLDVPTQNNALARQDIWVSNYYKRVLKVMGLKDDAGIDIRFRTITEDPVFRTLGGASIAFQTGAINQQEYRDLVLKSLDVKPTTNELPQPNGFTGAETTNPDLAAQNQLKIATMNAQVQKANNAAAGNATKPADRPNPIPSQGNTGKAGKALNPGNEIRNATKKPGTGSKP